MANICWFEMRCKGRRVDCYRLFNSNIRCYEAYIAGEAGTEDLYMLYIRGECRYSVTACMVNTEGEPSLAKKAKMFNLELEVCGLDESREIAEHFHYRGAEVIKENNLPISLQDWAVEEGETDLTAEELKKYEKVENAPFYVLKDEFQENFEYDDENEWPIFDFAISLDDLSGSSVRNS